MHAERDHPCVDWHRPLPLAQGIWRGLQRRLNCDWNVRLAQEEACLVAASLLSELDCMRHVSVHPCTQGMTVHVPARTKVLHACA